MEKGELLNEGKTKKIFTVAGNDTNVIIEYKNDITAFDDPSFTKQFETKARHSNSVTCGVFGLLQDKGIPVAYSQKLSDTEFLAPKCTMLPLEVIARRYAVGSYLDRHPECRKDENEEPHRFDEPLSEFFLKTTRGELRDSEGNVLVEGLDPKKSEEDPFIKNPHDREWVLLNSKKEERDADLGRTIPAAAVATPEQMREMERIVVEVFKVLETFWAQHNFKFIDFKIEFGITTDGQLVVADVIDNDSWRLRDQNWQDVSKQSFRDGDSLASIKDKYELVAELVKQGDTKE